MQVSIMGHKENEAKEQFSKIQYKQQSIQKKQQHQRNFHHSSIQQGTQ